MSSGTYRMTWEDHNTRARATGPRVTAFDDPIHWQQVLTAGTYGFVTLVGIISLGVMFQNSPMPLGVSMGITLLELAIVAGCWLYIELTDPSKPGGIPCSRMSKTQDSIAYCSLCRKEVQGLDHHCYFLNTCVGKRNYFFFFTMSLVATIQMALHVVWSILGMTVWREAGNDTPEYYILVALQTALAVAGGGGTISLLSFHIYLLWLGMGTYDWMWKKQADRRQKEQEAARIRFEEDQAKQAKRHREMQRAEAEAVAAASKPGAAGGGTVGRLGGEDAKVHAITVAAVPLTAGTEPPAAADDAAAMHADMSTAFGPSGAGAAADDMYAEDTVDAEAEPAVAGEAGRVTDNGSGLGDSGVIVNGADDDLYGEFRDDDDDSVKNAEAAGGVGTETAMYDATAPPSGVFESGAATDHGTDGVADADAAAQDADAAAQDADAAAQDSDAAAQDSDAAAQDSDAAAQDADAAAQDSDNVDESESTVEPGIAADHQVQEDETPSEQIEPAETTSGESIEVAVPEEQPEDAEAEEAESQGEEDGSERSTSGVDFAAAAAAAGGDDDGNVEDDAAEVGKDE